MPLDEAHLQLAQDLGAIKTRVDEHEKRMDRTDAANAAIFSKIDGQFADLKDHLTRQDDKLDKILDLKASLDVANAAAQAAAAKRSRWLSDASIIGSLIGGAVGFWVSYLRTPILNLFHRIFS